jgi:rare lipoprotein A
MSLLRYNREPSSSFTPVVSILEAESSARNAIRVRQMAVQKRGTLVLLGALAPLVVACRHESAGASAALTSPAPQGPAASQPTYTHDESGKATYYANSLAGRRTASGERYDPRAFTAAHKTLAFGSMVRVVRVDDGREVVVRINDRGPFAGDDRVIDLSRAAAEQLGMIRDGVVPVRVLLR